MNKLQIYQKYEAYYELVNLPLPYDIIYKLQIDYFNDNILFANRPHPLADIMKSLHYDINLFKADIWKLFVMEFNKCRDFECKDINLNKNYINIFGVKTIIAHWYHQTDNITEMLKKTRKKFELYFSTFDELLNDEFSYKNGRAFSEHSKGRKIVGEKTTPSEALEEYRELDNLSIPIDQINALKSDFFKDVKEKYGLHPIFLSRNEGIWKGLKNNTIQVKTDISTGRVIWITSYSGNLTKFKTYIDEIFRNNEYLFLLLKFYYNNFN